MTSLRCIHFALGILGTSLLGAAHAQEQVTMDFNPRPSRSLLSSTRTASTQLVNISGDEELIARYKASGVTMPMRLATSENTRTRNRAGAPRPDGSFETRLDVLEVDASMTDPLGKVSKMENGLSTFVGSKFNMVFWPGTGHEFVSVEGSTVRPDVARAVASALTGLLKSMGPLNGATMKVGDSRPLEVHFDMPLPGSPPLRFEGVSTYTLTGIRDGIALFSFVTDFILKQKPGGLQVNGDGKGSGTMEYDIANSLLRATRSSSTMNMVMQINKTAFNTVLEMTQTITQTIEKD